MLCLLGTGWGVGAPATRLLFRSYGREQGLRNITVSQLLQDRQGLLWAGTDEGLYRYDGARFQPFGSAQGLKSALVNVLTPDTRGAIWVGTAKGLARLREGRFEIMDRGIPAEETITDLANGSEGELWVGTPHGLFVGDAEKGFRALPNWGDRRVYALCASSDGHQLWVAGRDALWQIDAKGALQRLDEGGRAGLEGIDRLLADATGNLWVRSAKGLYFLSAQGHQLRSVPGALPVESSRSRMVLDAQGMLWYPNEKGVGRLEQGRWTQIGLQDGLPADFARAALVDHEGSLWGGLPSSVSFLRPGTLALGGVYGESARACLESAAGS